MRVRAVIYVLALAGSALAEGWMRLAIPILAIAGFEAVQRYRKMHQAARWRGWPLTRGMVDNVNVRLDRLYFSELAYSYAVAGTRYSGFHQTGFDSEELAWEFCQAFEKALVEVRYDPKEPQISLLAI